MLTSNPLQERLDEADAEELLAAALDTCVVITITLPESLSDAALASAGLEVTDKDVKATLDAGSVGLGAVWTAVNAVGSGMRSCVLILHDE